MSNMHVGYYKIDNNSIVTILGGNGFIGQHIVAELAKSGAVIRVIGRNATDAKQLMTTGYVGQVALIDMDLKDEAKLQAAIKSSDVVINLIGIMHISGKQTFQRMHIELAEKIAKLCTLNDVKRLVHISALGIDHALNSNYAKSKLEAEFQILKYYPKAIILRPSVVFGPGDSFINLFNSIASFSPFIPLIGGGKTKFQPIFVSDLAKAVSLSLEQRHKNLCGEILEIGGPNILTLKEMMQIMLAVTDRKRWLINIPFSLAMIQAFFMELLPAALLTRDQVALLKYNNVINGVNGLKTLGIKPTTFQAGIFHYLKS